ncbi:hypothetical protein [Sphingomonas aerophila]|uniref:Uncharacterized protein n=1 Tax=Sphingomonas aerophila TaxID=1344948 RepID=A0A7W9BCN8_9SPHN|nr:hypothetical protein [Sphingomonas aerophila]MBB5714762.1 hypothetical protein [Sphingomonas aerophila]
MASASDVATVIVSALAEIGMTGEVDATKDGVQAVQWIGSPSGNDVQVVVTVQPLDRSDG